MSPGDVRERLTLLPERMQLPRGRSALPDDQVAASQRGRIMQAIVEVVAERGYPSTSVQDVIRRARVSRTAFYDCFVDKQDAFAHAHAAASQQLLDLIAAAVHAVEGADWRTRHRAGVTAYLDGFRSAPAYAVSFMVELRSAGSRLLDQRDQVLERHARRIAAIAKDARHERPDRPTPSELAIIGAAAAGDELVAREVRAGRIAQLGELVGPIVEVHLAVIAGE